MRALRRSKFALCHGTTPYYLAQSDLNGDRKPDLVNVNFGSNSISILLNSGNGSFGAKTDYAVGSQPSSATISDFNGDGKMDLAVMNGSPTVVSIFPGKGDGTFLPKTDLITPIGFNVVASDVNSDGKMDLVSPNYLSGTVSVQLGNGNGTFATRTDFPVGTNPTNVVVGDFNNDGKPDVAAMRSAVVSVLLGNGYGDFSTATDYTVAIGSFGIVAADLNHDGKIDLAITSNSPTNSIASVSVLTGKGDGTFNPKIDYAATAPRSIAVVDFNGDNFPDLVTTSRAGNAISLLLNNGSSGGFKPKTDIAISTGPFSVVATDFNGDGKADLATSNYDSANVSVMLNSCVPPSYSQAAVTLTREQGSTANSSIVTVPGGAGAYTVTATNIPAGLSVTNIVNTNGTITADVAADCTAAIGQNIVDLQITDALGAKSGSLFVVNVTASTVSVPAMTTQPVAQGVVSGNPVTFSVAGTNATAIQWQVSTNGGHFWTTLQGATAATLSFPTSVQHNGNRYRAVLSNCTGAAASNTAQLTVTAPVSPPASTTGLVIREFRLRGSGGTPAQDEYLELYNLTANSITVNNGGWAVAASANGTSFTTVATIPNGTIIPSKGHYLIVNLNGYSLTVVAAGDATYSSDIADDSGLAIFNSPSVFNATTRIDSVGSQSLTAGLFREGTGLPNLSANNGDYAWVRKMQNGQVIDTDDNLNDFILVSPTASSINGVIARLGVPSPANSSGAVEMNSQIIQSLFDPTVASTASPNQERDLTVTTNADFGTLTLRRSFTNYSGAALTKMRFRLIDVTNTTATGEADIRALNSVTATINGKIVEGLTILSTPAQPKGGGLNSVLVVGPDLPAGATINIEFKLGVVRKGQYRYILNIEASK